MLCSYFKYFSYLFVSLLIISSRIYFVLFYYCIIFLVCGPKVQTQRSPKPNRPHGLPARPAPWASPTRGPLNSPIDPCFLHGLCEHSPAAWHALSRMVLLLPRICPRFPASSPACCMAVSSHAPAHVAFVQAHHLLG